MPLPVHAEKNKKNLLLIVPSVPKLTNKLEFQSYFSWLADSTMTCDIHFVWAPNQLTFLVSPQIIYWQLRIVRTQRTYDTVRSPIVCLVLHLITSKEIKLYMYFWTRSVHMRKITLWTLNSEHHCRVLGGRATAGDTHSKRRCALRTTCNSQNISINLFRITLNIIGGVCLYYFRALNVRSS